MSNAPEVRGLFLKALGRPVIVAPSEAEPTVTFDGPLTEVCPCSLKETELPSSCGRGTETYEVRPTRTGERTIMAASPSSRAVLRASVPRLPEAWWTPAVSCTSPI